VKASVIVTAIITIITGGLFDMTDTVQEIAFRYAVDRVNVDSEVLPRSRLTAQIERIPAQDSFYASKQGDRL
jgi:ionotropic glutamate receptor